MLVADVMRGLQCSQPECGGATGNGRRSGTKVQHIEEMDGLAHENEQPIDGKDMAGVSRSR